MVGNPKETTFPGTAGLMHISTDKNLTACFIKPAEILARQNLGKEKRKGALTKKHLVLGSLWKKENKFSSM